MAVITHIERIITGIKKGSFSSEAAVSQGIVMPILAELGWPVFDTSIVIPEYSIEGQKVDYALCHPENRPAIFIEVKKIGYTQSADRQLFEYAFHVGVPMAILTDGQEWNFYLPGEQGRYDERRVYKIDFLERSPDEAKDRLIRYLSFDRVSSGEALQAARADYQNVARDREIKVTLPKAWNTLLTEQDSILLELIAEKVEDICGYRPDLDTCSRFIGNITQTQQDIPRSQPTIQKEEKDKNHHEIDHGRTRHTGRFVFKFKSQTYEARSARDVMIRIFQLLSQEDSSFLDRFAARKHGRKRRYIAKNKLELYPDRSDLAEIQSVEVVPGWWMGTNYSRKNIQEIIELAIEVIGPKLGSTIKVKLD